MKILVLNGGSSSLKASLREVDGATPSVPVAPLWQAEADWGRNAGKVTIHAQGPGGKLDQELDLSEPAAVLDPIMESLWSGTARALSGAGEIDAVGHRVVHGGTTFQESARIDAAVREGIQRNCEFAPEHNRLELEAIVAAERILGPKVPQFAVFDTQFHVSMPEAAKVFAAPYEWYKRGIRRYGFHGISHQYVTRRATELLGGGATLRLVSCHLGNGASLAAVSGGRSIDTTMGFTPLDGLVMGTRSGSIDPGILIYLVRHQGCGADELDRLLNKESGLKGVSGISGDMREILAGVDRGDARAQLAFDVYTHRLTREIGAMTASLGGLDALIFTAGVGENSPPVRSAACKQLAFLGVHLDESRNAAPARDSDVATADSRVRVLVLHTDEDWEITRECVRLAG
jgi:acetate kinase